MFESQQGVKREQVYCLHRLLLAYRSNMMINSEETKAMAEDVLSYVGTGARYE